MKRTRIKRKSGRQREVDALHDLLRQVALVRDAFRCQKCGADRHAYPQPVLQAAHVYGKGAHPSMRFMLDNVIILCKPCHFWWHQVGFGREASSRKNEVREFCIQAIGKERMERLDLRSRIQGKRVDLKLERIALEQELRRQMEGE